MEQKRKTQVPAGLPKIQPALSMAGLQEEAWLRASAGSRVARAARGGVTGGATRYRKARISTREQHAGKGRGLRDRALGKGQVIEEHIQATVLLVKELLHPPADTGPFSASRKVLPRVGTQDRHGPPGRTFPRDARGLRQDPRPGHASRGVGRGGGREAVLDTYPGGGPQGRGGEGGGLSKGSRGGCLEAELFQALPRKAEPWLTQCGLSSGRSPAPAAPEWTPGLAS